MMEVVREVASSFAVVLNVRVRVLDAILVDDLVNVKVEEFVVKAVWVVAVVLVSCLKTVIVVDINTLLVLVVPLVAVWGRVVVVSVNSKKGAVVMVLVNSFFVVELLVRTVSVILLVSYAKALVVIVSVRLVFLTTMMYSIWLLVVSGIT